MTLIEWTNELSLTGAHMVIVGILLLIAFWSWAKDLFWVPPEEPVQEREDEPGDVIRRLLKHQPINQETGIGYLIMSAKNEGHQSVTLTREEVRMLASAMLRSELDNYCRYRAGQQIRDDVPYQCLYTSHAPHEVNVVTLYKLEDGGTPVESLSIIVRSTVAILTDYLISSMSDGFLLYGVILNYKES